MILEFTGGTEVSLTGQAAATHERALLGSQSLRAKMPVLHACGGANGV